MKFKMTMLALFAGATAVYAQNTLTAELKQNYAQVKATVTKAADDMPEADYGFIPGPGSRTYGQAVAHVAEAQAGLCGMASGKEAPKVDENKGSKAEATAALKAAFDFCDPIYAAMTDADATKTVKMFGRDRTMFGVLDAAVIHSNEMYGTLAVYLRAKNKVPPSTAGRGQGKKKE
ncbi:MAG: DinB family protein [Acidobacteriota bacterium]|nr:DinB family protein [Acidobacteriota bacterium]